MKDLGRKMHNAVFGLSVVALLTLAVSAPAQASCSGALLRAVERLDTAQGLGEAQREDLEYGCGESGTINLIDYLIELDRCDVAAQFARSVPLADGVEGATQRADRCLLGRFGEALASSRSSFRSPSADAERSPVASSRARPVGPTMSSSRGPAGCGLAEHRAPTALTDLSFQVWFAHGSSALRPEALATLQTLADFMEEQGFFGLLVVEGHTDSTGTASYNQLLSEARASRVSMALKRGGLTRSRLESRGFGEHRPRYENGSAAGRARNRRVEFRLLWGAEPQQIIR